MANSGYSTFPPIREWDVSVDNDVWSEFASRLDTARGSATEEDVRRALDIALRSAALESGAIEGLYATDRGITTTVALQGAMWEAALDKLGRDVRGHFEAQLAAFDLVLDVAANNVDLGEAWLRELHAQVTAKQKTYRVWTEAAGWQDHPLPHGEYKIAPNLVTLADGRVHHYVPLEDTPAEVHRLLEQMRSPEFTSAHPAIQAAYAHHAMTVVHPFADGNGRTARALASVYLYRAAGVPLVIFSDQQERYWDALAAADRGEPQGFVTFVENRVLDTMAMVADRLRQAHQHPADHGMRIRELLVSHGGLPHQEIEILGDRILRHVQRALHTILQSADLPTDLELSNTEKNGRLDCTFWDRPYRTLQTGGAFTLTVTHREPLMSAEITPFVGVAKDLQNRFAFIVIDANRQTSHPLRLRVEDVHPSLSATAEALIEGWAGGGADVVLHALTDGIAAALRMRGL